MQKPGRATPSGVEIAYSKATLSTSRRGFMRATAVVSAALLGTLVPGGVALADPVGIPNCPEPSNSPNCVCFLMGTHILTPRGEVTIESLTSGDLVSTVDGQPRPAKWIGRMAFERQGHQSWHPAVLPILVERGALDGVRPSRDLYVSDAHCFFINGLLIPAIHLVNGRTIRKSRYYEPDTIEYFHIELERHDVIFANGAPAETLLGNDNRRNFDNFDEYVQLYGPELVALSPFAPVVGNFGGRQELRSRLRSALAPIYDRRQPIDIIRDGIAQRAEQRLAA